MGFNSVWLGLFLVAAVFLVWRDSMRARELATAACRDICRRHDVQFLDDTVSLSRMAPCRNGPRGFSIRRTYTFEFSAEGATRSTGSITMASDRIEGVFLPGITQYLEH